MNRICLLLSKIINANWILKSDLVATIYARAYAHCEKKKTEVARVYIPLLPQPPNE